ncbi:MAG: DUF2157 domain-containing protein [Prosthecobacter sp.]|uniref:DUF2157 domain-containing protein n=1 Tax=Prosthecobacter sp. TaxID=1965333 RepID=UPI001A06EB2F|nr:DUF2157 domain-containing protein [Prosthecobacter sp.]MBE2287011.1 DUF2157 domain-containing protein [Prosthecobacter sp.]
MNSHHRWLHEQLPQWERDGIVTAENARSLRQRHPLDDSTSGVGQIVMGALGALLIGAGLIAVIGYNWDDFSRPVRLLFAFLPLLAAQIASFRVLQRGDAAAAWVRETVALLQALATGACIAIVSQIYNLGGEWPDFLFWWMLLSLPLVWVLRSQAVAIFYLIAIATWSVSQIETGRAWHDSPLLYPLLLLGLLPWWPGWPPKTALSVSVRWVMTISAIFGLCSAAVFVCEQSDRFLSFQFETAMWLWTLTAAAFALFPLNQAAFEEPTRRKPQVVLGSLWLLGYGLAMTNHEIGRDILMGVSRSIKLPWCWGLLIVLILFVLHALRRRRWAVLSLSSIVILPLPSWLTMNAMNSVSQSMLSLPSWLATLHLAAIGLTLIVLDFSGRRGAPRFGALLLSVLIILRMADSHFSLLAKGVGFIVVGIAFLAFNLLMSRRRRPSTLPAA